MGVRTDSSNTVFTRCKWRRRLSRQQNCRYKTTSTVIGCTIPLFRYTLGTDDVEVKLDDSFGFMAQVGANYKIDKNWGLHAMVSIMDIDTDATVYANGAKSLTSTVELDPVVAMFGVRYSF